MRSAILIARRMRLLIIQYADTREFSETDMDMYNKDTDKLINWETNTVNDLQRMGKDSRV